MLFKLAPFVPYKLSFTAEVNDGSDGSCVYLDATMSIESVSNLASVFKTTCKFKDFSTGNGGGLPEEIDDVYDVSAEYCV